MGLGSTEMNRAEYAGNRAFDEDMRRIQSFFQEDLHSTVADQEQDLPGGGDAAADIHGRDCGSYGGSTDPGTGYDGPLDTAAPGRDFMRFNKHLGWSVWPRPDKQRIWSGRKQ